MSSLDPTPSTRHPEDDPALRFGLIGCGRVAPTHFRAIAALEEKGTLVAVCDTDPTALENAAQRTGADPYADYADLLARDDIDIISICTPSGLHAEHGIAAAKAGKHVVVEKPIDVSLEKAEALVNACEDNGVQLYPIFQNRLNATVQLAKEAIDKGRLGKLYAIRSTMIWKRKQTYYDTASWRGTKAMDGGAFMNQGIHFVDAMRFLGGEIMDIKSTLATLARDIECEDIGSALFRFESGALGNIFVTTLGRYDQEGSIDILGEKGQITLGGSCMNSIDTWDFDEPDEEMDARAKESNYTSDSIYGDGHKGTYARMVGLPPHNPATALATVKAVVEIMMFGQK